MEYEIISYSGYFYVQNKNTGKLLINKSFKRWEDAKREAIKL